MGVPSGRREERAARIPVELLERAETLRPVLAEMRPGPRWSMSAVLRLALEWGLDYLEELTAAGLELEGPSLSTAGPDGDVGVRPGDVVHFRDGVDDSDGVVVGAGAGGRVHVAWDGGVSTWHYAEEVAEWLARGFVKDSKGRPRWEAERPIKFVFLNNNLAEEWGERVCSPAAARHRAVEYLGGTLTEDGRCRYIDEGTQEEYTAGPKALEALGAALLAGKRDVYSLWCARFGDD